MLLNPRFANRRPQSRTGFTLVEMMVVVGIVLLLAALAIPSISALTENSNVSGTRNMLRSLLSSAKARAANSQKYVGVRFEQNTDGRTYGIMVEPPPGTNLFFPNGCPGSIWTPPGRRDPNCSCASGSPDCVPGYLTLVESPQIEPIVFPRGVEITHGNQLNNIASATAFTILFSPSGQVVRKNVYVSRALYTGDPVFAASLRDDFDLFGGIRTDITRDSLRVYDQEKRIAVGQDWINFVNTQAVRLSLNVYNGSLIDSR
jgi:prepilin-type N-terminal cleavage/methylation domain-containing protein